MAIISKSGKSHYAPQEEKPPKVSFAIRDTEFLIRLILASQIEGKDVEIASKVLGKIKKIHEKLILKSQEIM
tara:strand:- start:1303 stop:1518 length:216 start_codon:yes stop_codon:yes gene_type:complete